MYGGLAMEVNNHDVTLPNFNLSALRYGSPPARLFVVLRGIGGTAVCTLFGRLYPL